MARKRKIDCGGPRARYCRERQFSPRKCLRGTTRTVKSGSARVVVCRVRGLRGKSRAQSILRPFTNPKCAACRVR